MVGVIGISDLEFSVKIVEFSLALFIYKFIVYCKSNKHYGSYRSYLVDQPTLIDHFNRIQILRSSMSDHFFLSCIGLSLSISIAIGIRPRVKLCLVVIALSIESESSRFFPDTIVVLLKMLAFVDIGKVRI